MPERTKLLILGAAGRDFHDFNVAFRADPSVQVVAFTATQIPNIEGRRYPPSLAGPLYPEGIPIYPEAELERLIEAHDIDDVVFSYSDVEHGTVMHHACRAQAAGAGFRLLGPKATMLASTKPVLSVCAVRTGVGKSPTTRHIANLLRDAGSRVAIVRHPMPYGDLAAQAVQRFATLEDLSAQHCTIEEMEEYEPHINQRHVVFAGVDYERILRAAEQEADVVLWDGGNNDFPFYASDFEVVLLDPHRPGDEARFYPGETNLRRADVLVLSKVGTADPAMVDEVRIAARLTNPTATVVEGDLAIEVDRPELLRAARALVIEDGPTTTHGGMPYGAGWVAARAHGATLTDPRPFAQGTLRETFAKYPHLTQVLPAMGYGDAQIHELEATIARCDCDVVVIATPVDLRRLMTIGKPTVRVTYSYTDRTDPTLSEALQPFVKKLARG
ncbi:MAG: GTPase [Myxococcales bacterium]|nr:GTPase [Myxococcales bacterium]